MKPAWLTNIPEISAKLNAADAAYENARETAKSLSLADKIVALRQAKQDRINAYAKAIKS